MASACHSPTAANDTARMTPSAMGMRLFSSAPPSPSSAPRRLLRRHGCCYSYDPNELFSASASSPRGCCLSYIPGSSSSSCRAPLGQHRYCRYFGHGFPRGHCHSCNSSSSSPDSSSSRPTPLLPLLQPLLQPRLRCPPARVGRATVGRSTVSQVSARIPWILVSGAILGFVRCCFLVPVFPRLSVIMIH